MSLTEWLHRNRVARGRFRNNMIPMRRRPVPPLLVWPNFDLSPEDAGTIGRAYDYWFRVVCITANRLGTARFRDFRGYKYFYDEMYPAHRHLTDAVNACMNAFDKCYDSQKFLDSGLLRNTLVLSFFERASRTGEPFTEHQLYIPPAIIDQLTDLARASDVSWAAGNIVLNPEFGVVGTRGTLAADGDIIVNGTLYDFKTGREMRRWETLRQLLGYAVLNSFRPKPYRINSVGYYYVRFDLREELQLSDLCTLRQFETLQTFVGRTVGKRPRATGFPRHSL